MGTGNLEGKVVQDGFWPGCKNCRHYKDCQLSPLHLGFPYHTWAWLEESVEIEPGRVLILVSVIGSSMIAKGECECAQYEVAPEFADEPNEVERRVVELDKRYRSLEEQLDRRHSSKLEKECREVVFQLMELAGVS
jgi:hypothetical protein